MLDQILPICEYSCLCPSAKDNDADAVWGNIGGLCRRTRGTFLVLAGAATKAGKCHDILCFDLIATPSCQTIKKILPRFLDPKSKLRHLACRARSGIWPQPWRIRLMCTWHMRQFGSRILRVSKTSMWDLSRTFVWFVMASCVCASSLPQPIV